MLKETVSIEVQGFFDKNNNFILKEIGIVFEEDPNFAKYKISKDCNLVNQYTSQRETISTDIFWESSAH